MLLIIAIVVGGIADFIDIFKSKYKSQQQEFNIPLLSPGPSLCHLK